MSLSILLAEDEADTLTSLAQQLEKRGYEVFAVDTLAKARQHVKLGEGDIIVTDHSLGDGLGTSLIGESARAPHKPPVIIITAYGDIHMAVDAMKAGAVDFIPKPFSFDYLEKSIKKAAEVVATKRELDGFRAIQHQNVEFIIGKNPQMQRVYSQAKRAAEHGVSVLITGETGTGKEMLAKWIHLNSKRSGKIFWPINCAVIQPSLMESELFGYEKNAFTNADARKLGQLEIADGGIVFLDEISSMPAEVQAKLLRFLEDKSFVRLGGIKPTTVDVHFIAATNRNLPDLISSGGFREDLYFRLNTLDLQLPPLRERREDIPELVGFFIRKFNREKGLNIQGIAPEALQALVHYDWPGNVRQLRNVIEHSMVFADKPILQLNDLPDSITSSKNGKT